MDDKRFIELLAKKKSGQLTLPEQRELSELENKDSYYSLMESYVDEVFKTSLNFEPSLSSRVQQSSFEIIKEKINKLQPVSQSNKSKIFRILQVAAAIILIVALSVIGYLNSGKPVRPASSNIVSTKKGSKSNIVLPDGTQVWLNADTKIIYDKGFGDTTREVTLTGEAFFDVTHDANRPFIIHTGKADIRVLGTTFNVRNYAQEDFVETSLIKGKIEVTLLDQPDKKIILKPSEKLVVYKTEQNASVSAVAKKTKHPDIMALTHITVKDSIVAEMMWMQNSMSFINKPLIEIARELERQYNINVVFRSEKAKSYHYTIYLNNYSLQEAIQALQTLKKFNYSINNNELIIE